MSRADKNILVISDLHLGEDLKPHRSVAYLRHVARLERELERFLAHYTTHRLHDRPWRLVVNGDMVDFMSIMILPEEENASLDERQYGLGYGEQQSAAKLARVFDRHPEVFRRLADFVAAGNELVIVVGNHDVEFYYPAVQRCFTDRLAQMVGGPFDDARFRQAITFCTWFYYEEDLVYVEHGHQYDEYCSFDYQLYPVQPTVGVALSIAHAGMRYFSNLVPSLDPHCGETWGFLDYMRWGWAHGARGLARLALLYGSLIRKLVALWSSLTDRESDRARAERHDRALRDLAGQYRIAVDKLEALDRLHCVPVMKRLARVLSAMFLDRMLVGVALAIGVVLVLTLPETWWVKLAGVGAVLGVGVAVNWLLGRMRSIPSALALRRTPGAIRRILRAPFIVFGHSHTTERVALPDGGVYFNTGTWADTEGRDSYPHLVIVAQEDEPRAELRSWRNGAILPFEEIPPPKVASE